MYSLITILDRSLLFNSPVMPTTKPRTACDSVIILDEMCKLYYLVCKSMAYTNYETCAHKQQVKPITKTDPKNTQIVTRPFRP